MSLMSGSDLYRVHPQIDERDSLSLLGNFALHVAGRNVLLSESAQRLLVLVTLRGTQRRTFLAGTLWPEMRDEQALTRLRSTLWRLRRHAPTLLTIKDQTIGLSEGIDVDLRRFVGASRKVMNGLLEEGDVSEVAAEIINAKELLSGWYEDWVLQERDRLTSLRVHALEALVDVLLRGNRYAEALEAAMTAVHVDPLRESTHRSVMRVHLAEGNPASAKRQLELYRRILRNELGVDQPTRAMMDLMGSSWVQQAR